MELTVGGLKAAARVARTLPKPVTDGLARAISLGAARFSPEQRLMAERNLRRALGPAASDAEIERMAQRVFDSYARYWVDTLSIPELSNAEIDRGFTYEGLNHIDDALAKGIGPILALPHLGGWEWAARWLSSVAGWKVAAVVEVLEPPELFEWFVDLRRQFGINVIPLGDGAALEVGAAILNGEIMCLLADRDVVGGGVEVEFFGERTRIPFGPALLALRTGAPILPTTVYFVDDHCHGLVGAPLEVVSTGNTREDVARISQDLARVMEEHIKKQPEQWHLLQPNWPSDYEALGLPLPDSDTESNSGAKSPSGTDSPSGTESPSGNSD